MPKIDVKCLTVGDFQVNCYLVVNTETRGCLIVDPGAEGERIIRAAQEYKPAAVLLTHAHWDHIGAVDAVCGHFGIPLYVHEADAPKLTDSTKNVARQFGCDVTVATRPHLLHGGETLFLADMEIRVETARQMVAHALKLMDAGLPYSRESAIAKCYAGDIAVQNALDAIQILGGYGYSREYPVEKLLRDAKIFQIYEGTNQIQRMVIGKSVIGKF